LDDDSSTPGPSNRISAVNNQLDVNPSVVTDAKAIIQPNEESNTTPDVKPNIDNLPHTPNTQPNPLSGPASQPHPNSAGVPQPRPEATQGPATSSSSSSFSSYIVNNPPFPLFNHLLKIDQQAQDLVATRSATKGVLRTLFGYTEPLDADPRKLHA
jgi:hypothetical protein